LEIVSVRLAHGAGFMRHGGWVIIFIMYKALAVLFSAGVMLNGCGGPEPVAEARLAQALEALQQGRVDEASRVLAAIKPGGGWLRSATWTGPLALRLRAQIALRNGVREEAVRLLKEYSNRYGSLAPAQYTNSRLEFIERFSEWQGQPALLYLRGLEAQSDTPALAIREWRTLLRDFPACSLAPNAQLQLGLLQKRLGNAAWALSELSNVAKMPNEVVDPSGNPLAPQALLAIGETQFELMADRFSARQTLEGVASSYSGIALKGPEGFVDWSPSASAKFILARINIEAGESASGVSALESLAVLKGPTGYYSEALAGDIRAEARLMLADNCMKNRQYARMREHLLEVARKVPEVLRGPLDGARRKYAFEAADRLEGLLGVRSPEEALKGLAELAAESKSREAWVYYQLKRVKILARLGQRNAARETLSEMEKRFPSLEVDPLGDGLLLIPAREARRVLGG